MESFWLIVKFCWNHWFGTVLVCAVLAVIVDCFAAHVFWGDERPGEYDRPVLVLSIVWLAAVVIFWIIAVLWIMVIPLVIVVAIVVYVRRRRAFPRDPGFV